MEKLISQSLAGLFELVDTFEFKDYVLEELGVSPENIKAILELKEKNEDIFSGEAWANFLTKLEKYEILEKAKKYKEEFVKKFSDLGVTTGVVRGLMTEVEGNYFFEVDVIHPRNFCQIFSYTYLNKEGKFVTGNPKECRFTDFLGDAFDTDITQEFVDNHILLLP